MKVAISGKGGTGKTTVSGTLARLAARQGIRTLALDCDSNPNLALSIGLDLDTLAAMTPLPKTVRGDMPEPAERLISEHAVDAPDGVRLVLGARVEQAAGG